MKKKTSRSAARTPRSSHRSAIRTTARVTHQAVTRPGYQSIALSDCEPVASQPLSGANPA